MKTTLCTWEDETSNRNIQFSVEYSIENGAIAINTVTPQKVSFITDGTVERSVGVHTDAGRILLAEQFRNSPAWDKLPGAIAHPNGDAVIPNMTIRMDVATV